MNWNSIISAELKSGKSLGDIMEEITKAANEVQEKNTPWNEVEYDEGSIQDCAQDLLIEYYGWPLPNDTNNDAAKSFIENIESVISDYIKAYEAGVRIVGGLEKGKIKFKEAEDIIRDWLKEV